MPVVLQGLDIGTCTNKWTTEYLAKVGGDRDVKVHVSQTPQMDFINKNFMYRYKHNFAQIKNVQLL